MISSEALNLIMNSEGLRLTAYKCPAGIWTIGYGHTKNVTEGDVITFGDAYSFLLDDLYNINKQIAFLKGLRLTQHSALLSFIFNVGIGNWNKSTLKKLIIANPNDPQIKHEFEKWVWAKGKKLNGLVIRRNHEVNLYFS